MMGRIKEYYHDLIIKDQQKDIYMDEPKNKYFSFESIPEKPVVRFEIDKYQVNDATAVMLYTDQAEQYATISVNVPGTELLPEGEFYLKDYSENQYIAQELIARGIILPTGSNMVTGFVTVKSYKVNPEYI